MGLDVEEAEEGATLSFESLYAGAVKAKMIISDRSGAGYCAVVESPDGTYQTIIDNWNNPIVSKVGNDCATLCRDYASEIVSHQAMLMGGSIVGREVNTDGSLRLRVQLS